MTAVPSPLRRRSPLEWGVRLLLAVLAGWLGFVAVVHTIAASLADSDPERAFLLAPSDGTIAASLAQQLSEPGATDAERARSDKLARVALLRNAASADAVASLGANAQARGDMTSAARYFAYSQALSRRELRSQAWGIQEAAAHNDIPAMIAHYDIILRVSPVSSPVMLPALATAIVDPRVRAALIKALARKPDWGPAFINYIATDGPDPSATAVMLDEARRAGIAVPYGNSAAVIDALLSAGQVSDAWNYYQRLTPRADRRTSRDPHFVANHETPSPFDWVPQNDGGVSTSLQGGSDDRGTFVFQAPPSVGGPLLKQVELLPPGDYILSGRSKGVSQPADSQPYWTLTCRGGAELGRVPLVNSAQSGGAFSGRITVPASCPVQTLALNALPSSEIAGLSGEIDEVALKPAR
jgi:hypothetical protein